MTNCLLFKGKPVSLNSNRHPALDRLIAALYKFPTNEVFDAWQVQEMANVGRTVIQMGAKSGALGECVIEIRGSNGSKNYRFGNPKAIAKLRKLLEEEG
ncbi:MAG: hypothetical protein C5B44_05755 [Acidobacteria bacterium]|nr:MAG: hypothetical protein C5B44_05755 [Acidobacteriota bacterium]